MVACAALMLACSNGGSGGPTAPSGATVMLDLQWGSMAVNFGNCPNVDIALLEDSVTASYDKARSALGSRADTVSLNGFSMSGDMNLECAGGPAYGCYYAGQDRAEFRCAYENVARHELQHRFCYELNLGCDCARVDHPGGFDLACQPL